MTRRKHTGIPATWKEAFGGDADWLRGVVQGVVQEVLESEMDECLQARKRERTAERLGYRCGHYGRTLVTRVAKPLPRLPGACSRRLARALGCSRAWVTKVLGRGRRTV